MDVNDGRRVSEDFYWNPNSSIIDSMLPTDQFKSLPWYSSNNQYSETTNDNHHHHHHSISNQPNIISSPNRITRRHAPPPPPPNNNLMSPYGTQSSISLDCLYKCRTVSYYVPLFFFYFYFFCLIVLLTIDIRIIDQCILYL